MVLAAGQRSSPDSEQALASLCQVYWYPLYAFVRRQGHQPAEAQDLTQEFFSRLLEKEYLQAADQQRGRFRSFLLTVLKRFLANHRQRAAAQKRGGGAVVLSLDFDTAERRLRLDPSHECTPQVIFERQWALTLLDRVLERLGEDYIEHGKGELFERLKRFLQGDDGAETYREIAAQLGMSEGSIKVAVHRLRQRYGRLLRHEIAQTVGGEEEVDDELGHLLAAIRG